MAKERRVLQIRCPLCGHVAPLRTKLRQLEEAPAKAATVGYIQTFAGRGKISRPETISLRALLNVARDDAGLVARTARALKNGVLGLVDLWKKERLIEPVDLWISRADRMVESLAPLVGSLPVTEPVRPAPANVVGGGISSVSFDSALVGRSRVKEGGISDA